MEAAAEHPVGGSADLDVYSEELQDVGAVVDAAVCEDADLLKDVGLVAQDLQQRPEWQLCPVELVPTVVGNADGFHAGFGCEFGVLDCLGSLRDQRKECRRSPPCPPRERG